MIVKCSICGMMCEMDSADNRPCKSDEMAEHEAMHNSKNEIVEWVILW